MAVGNYNINGGKHFRSVVFKDVSLGDWLLFDRKDLGRREDICLSVTVAL